MTDQTTKGGPMARQAAMLCQDRRFQLYLDRRKRHKFGLSPDQLPDGTHDQQDARDWLCQACGIESRAELDHNTDAAGMFRTIRHRFNRWNAREKS
ncbi:hypothetical protein [Halomonas sp. M20]|uniref:hypothetical protein n=1 Tax=Halomonas sp. M20 TaxID=2763264 RepID=UPI001D0BB317|nr:hypothetical protein [Halomonas sp. M20]